MSSKITTLLFDFSWVLVFPKQKTTTRDGSVSQTYLQQSSTKQVHDILDFNQELVAWVRKTPLTSYVLSASSPEMLAALRPEFVPPFIDMFSTKTLSMSKHDPQTFLSIAEKLKVTPQNILFTDDNSGNIDAAKTAGLQTILFQSNQDFFKRIEKLI